MITFSKPLIAMAALISAGLVTAVDMAQSRPQELAPAAKVAVRFPKSNEMMIAGLRIAPPAVNAIAKGAKQPAPAATCTHEHWPYIADECLSAEEGAKARRPARTISLERKLADKRQDDRAPATAVASR